jgi:hypothetical protein
LREEAIMKKILIAATAVVVVTAPVLAYAEDERDRPATGHVAGDVLAPRPGAAIRDTVGTASPQGPRAGRGVDDRLIVEERPPSVSPPNCPGTATREACAR